jgi:hypothetical protein
MRALAFYSKTALLNRGMNHILKPKHRSLLADRFIDLSHHSAMPENYPDYCLRQNYFTKLALTLKGPENIYSNGRMYSDIA